MSGLYIHIPFCHAKCAYCDFFSTPRSEYASDYTDALIREFESRKYGYGTFRTIYLGGGTPSSLPPELLDRIFSHLPLNDAHEITIEVNPEDVTDNFARWLTQSPVNRVSMGVQSLNDNELRFIGRRHSANEALQAVDRLRSAGISNLSLDLIYGLPGQNNDSWRHTLNRIMEFEPEHLSAYALMIEPGTRLCAMKEAGKFKELPDEIVATMYARLCESTRNHGYEHYEISNFAKRGHASVHNSSYWNLTPYLGIGTGAHSFDGRQRHYNPNRIKDYINAPERFTVTEEETDSERINDYIMIRMRTADGLDLETFSSLFGTAVTDTFIASARRHILSGQLTASDGRIRIPEQYFLISDTIISDLMTD